MPPPPAPFNYPFGSGTPVLPVQQKTRCRCAPPRPDEEFMSVVFVPVTVTVGNLAQVNGVWTVTETPQVVNAIASRGGTNAGTIQAQFAEELKALHQMAAIRNGQGALATEVGVNTGLLGTINNKLGAAIPGGISGALTAFRTKFDNFARWIGLDRLLNILNLWASVHNAFQLSRDIGETLFFGFDNLFALFGFALKDDEGEDIPTSDWVGDQVEGLFIQLLGVETWSEIKFQVQKHNRIYQAGANIINTVRSLNDTLVNVAQILANYTGKIGNALRAAGEVFETAYDWMNPNPNLSNKFFTALERTEQITGDFAQVTGEIREVTEIPQQLQEQRAYLIQQLQTENEPPPDPPEPETLAAKLAAEKAASQTPEIQDSDFNGE
ncbi:MAG: hypothetical protein HC910_21545 [Spirulinaceae cyanobacterium SM2_1_0]|nr:hypothetical protein [Spirulinaceae cyanobacterium SM2_1_0]